MRFERNINIDVARFVFAFLVVIIHVPFVLSYYLWPFARLAVPFFYMVSGYYLYSDNNAKQQSNYTKSCVKYMKIWLKYTAIIYCICLSLNLYLGNEIFWTVEDVVQFFTYGTCNPTDVVCFNGYPFGISTLWFLYCGAVSIFILKILPNKWHNIVFVIFVVGMLVDYYYRARVCPPLLVSALPSIYVGLWLRKHMFIYSMRYTKLLLVVTGLFLCLEGFWAKSVGFKTEMYFSVFPFLVCLFLVLERTKTCGVITKVMTYFPVVITFDIYIWHRLFYLVMRMIGIQPKWISAVIVYVSVFYISWFFRRNGFIKLNMFHGKSKN